MGSTSEGSKRKKKRRLHGLNCMPKARKSNYLIKNIKTFNGDNTEDQVKHQSVGSSNNDKMIDANEIKEEKPDCLQVKEEVMWNYPNNIIKCEEIHFKSEDAEEEYISVVNFSTTNVPGEEKSSSKNETKYGKRRGTYFKKRVAIPLQWIKHGLVRRGNSMVFRKNLEKFIRKNLHDGASYRSIARELGIPVTTLKAQLGDAPEQAKIHMIKKIKSPKLISYDLECKLAAVIRDMIARFYGLLVRDMNHIILEFGQKHFVADQLRYRSRFCIRHKIFIHRTERSGKGFIKEHVTKFFKTLQALYEEYKYLPQNIYSMDEIVLPLPQILHPPDLTQPRCHSCDDLTILTCISAGGCYIPPTTVSRKPIFTPAADQTPIDVLELDSDCGVMTIDLFVQWLKFFREHVQPTKENPVLLLIDRHPAHRSFKALNFCTENFIHLIVIPSDNNKVGRLVELREYCDSVFKVTWYPMNKLQPLEEGYFKDLRTSFWESYVELVKGSPKEEFTERRLVDVFKKAHNKSFCAEKVREGFRKAGILPVCDDVFSAKGLGETCDL